MRNEKQTPPSVPEATAPLPLGGYEADEPRPEDYRSPNMAVVEGTIEEGIRESVLAGERFVKVRVEGKQKLLGGYLANDLYKYGLSETEIGEIHDRYLATKIVGGEVVFGKNPNAALGTTALKAIDDYDFRERQSGQYLDD